MKEPFLYDLVNKMYHFATDNLSEELKEQGGLNAFVLGSAGSYSLINLIQFASEKILPEKFNNNVLPHIEKGCQIGITAVPFLYALTNPNEFYQIVNEHPTYSLGIFGTYLGLMISANQHINKKLKKKESLKRIKKKSIGLQS